MARGELVSAGASSVVPWDHVPPVGPAGEADQPLTTTQLELLDDVLREAERFTGLRFSAYLGDLGTDSRGFAQGLISGLGADAPSAVLMAISPGQRMVEVVTGPEAARRVSDRAARLAVLAVVSSCTDGDIAGALVTGIRILADQAGTLPERSTW